MTTNEKIAHRTVDIMEARGTLESPYAADAESARTQALAEMERDDALRRHVDSTIEEFTNGRDLPGAEGLEVHLLAESTLRAGYSEEQYLAAALAFEPHTPKAMPFRASGFVGLAKAEGAEEAVRTSGQPLTGDSYADALRRRGYGRRA
jgi:hypothetical protein